MWWWTLQPYIFLCFKYTKWYDKEKRSCYTLEPRISSSGNWNTVFLPWGTCLPSVREGCDHRSSDRPYAELYLPSHLSWGPEHLWTQIECVYFSPRPHLATTADTGPSEPKTQGLESDFKPAIRWGRSQDFYQSVSLRKVVKGHAMSLTSLRYRHWTQEVLIRPGCVGIFLVIRM